MKTITQNTMLKKAQTFTSTFRKAFATVVVVLLTIGMQAQTAGDYRSNVATGNWSTVATWQTFNGTTWVAATDYPGQNPNTGQVVTLLQQAAITLDITPANSIHSLTIETGTPTTTLIMGNETLSVDENVNMTGSSATITFGTGTLNISGIMSGGSISAGTGTVNYEGNFAPAAPAGGYALVGYDYYNLTVTGGWPSFPRRLITNCSVSGTLLLDGGGFNIQQNQTLTIDGGASSTATVQIKKNSELQLNPGALWQTVAGGGVENLIMEDGSNLSFNNSSTNTTFPVFANYTIDPNSKVIYGNSGNQDINLPTTVAWGRFQIEGNGGGTKTLLSDIEVADIRILNSNTLDASTHTIVISGSPFPAVGLNLGTSGVFNPGTGTVSFKGVTPNKNVIQGSSTVNFYNLELDKSGGELELNQDITVANQLILTEGKIDAQSHSITLTNTTVSNQLSGGSSSSYIFTASSGGNLKRNGLTSASTNVLFPVGSSSYYLPVEISQIDAGSADFSVWAFQGLTTNGSSGGTTEPDKTDKVDAVWNINRTAGSGDAEIKVTWTAPLSGSALTDPAKIGLSRYNGSWSFPQGTTDLVARTVTATFNSFSPFSVRTVPPVPGGVTGSNLWLAADKGVSNSGTTLNGWTDQTGNNSFTKVGTVGYNQNAVNFNPTVEMLNGGGPVATLPNNRLDGNTAITAEEAFAVFKANINENTTIVGSSVASIGSSSFGISFFSSFNGFGNAVSASGNQDEFEQYNNPLKTVQYTVNNFDLTKSSGNAGRLNGLDQNLLPGNAPFSSITLTPVIGGTTNNDAFGCTPLDGEIAEIVLFPTALLLPDKIKVESYLAIKYGITLNPGITNYVASDGTPIWSATGYWNDVFGIGRDDDSGLDQSSSNSVNTGSGDGIGQSGKGNVVLTNPSSLADGDFLMLGHDASGLGEQTSDIPATMPTAIRLEREWKVTHTNDVGTVTLTFSTLGLTLSGTTAQDFELLIDTDGDGDFTTGPISTVAAATFANDEVTFNAVTLPNNAVFTFKTGDIPVGPGVLNASLWLKADDGVSNTGTSLTGWTDQTNTNNFSVTGAPGYATDAINFNPIVSFDNAQPYTTLPGDYLEGDASISYVDGFAVFRKTDANSGALIGSAQNALNLKYGRQVFGGYSGNENYTSAGTDASFFTNPLLAANQPFVLVGADAGGGHSQTLNGAAQTLSGGKSFSSITLNPPLIGGTNNDQGAPNNEQRWRHFRGEVAEMVLYSSSLLPAEKRIVQSYMALKYGISLDPSVTNYVASDGTPIWNNTTYWNDVFGIGKDDASSLDQSKSNSINTGSGDGTGQSGKGNIVIETTAALTDKQFLMIGHDNNSLSEQIINLTSSSNAKARIGRSWLVKNTGSVGTVDLSFSINGLAVTGITAADFQLLIDTDGDGDFTTGTPTVVPAASLAADVLSFTGVTLDDTDIFTFLTGDPVGPGVAGTNLWFKADAGVTVVPVTEVTTWANQGSMPNADVSSLPGTPADNIPDYNTSGADLINFNNSFSFRIGSNTIGDFFETGALFDFLGSDGSGGAVASQFVVYKKLGTNNTHFYNIDDGAPFGSGNVGQGILLGAKSDGQLLQESYRMEHSGGVAENETALLDMVATTSATLANSSFSLNKNAEEDQGGPFNQRLRSNTGHPLRFGRFLGPVGIVYPEVILSELIIYPRLLTSNERLIVQSYLAVKYGITLDPGVTNYLASDGTAIWNNTTYWNDVFGIGKDDDSGLNQPQSNSMNTGSGDGTGQNGEANLVLSNPTSLDDLDFLMIGNDDGALTGTVANLPNGVSPCITRWEREWVVQSTNTPGNVDLSLDITGISFPGATPSQASDLTLIIDANGDGDWSDANTTAASGFAGSVASFTGLSLPDGARFTFAFEGAKTITWTGQGAASPITPGFNDWNDPANWDLNSVPCDQDKVIIPGGSSPYPELNSNTQIAELELQTGTLGGITNMLRISPNGDLTVAASGSFTGNTTLQPNTRVTSAGDATNTNPDGILTIGGDLVIADGARLFFASEGVVELAGDMTYGNNPIIYNQGTLILNGTSVQTITQTAGTIAPRIYNLTIDNAAGVTLATLNSQEIKVFNVLEIKQGTLTTNDVLMIATENINPITYGRIATHAAGAIIGDVIMEKRLTNLNTGWRQMALPVSGTFGSVTKKNITFLLDNHIPANQRNMYVWDATGSGTGDYANGWIEAGSGDGANQAFSAFLSGTNGVHVVGNPSANNVDFQNIYSYTGSPNEGDFNNPLAFTRDPADATGTNADALGWNFIANPWPAMVGVDALLNDGTNFSSGYKAVHVWDAVNQNYVAISASGISIDYNTGGGEIDRATTNIPPMQGFWVKASATGQDANLIESTMRTTEVLSTPAFMKTVPEHFRLNVQDAENQRTQMVVAFDASATRKFDLVGDAYYLASQNDSVPVLFGWEGGSKASIISRPADVSDSIEVRYQSVKDQGKFTLTPDLSTVNSVGYIYLKDRMTSEVYALEDGQGLDFVNNRSFGGNRFVVYYSKTSNAFEHLVTGEKPTTIAYVRNEQVTLQSRGYSGEADVLVTDAVGRIVYRDKHMLETGAEMILPIARTNQLLLIRVTTPYGTTVDKLYY